jgi:hypothetical protein
MISAILGTILLTASANDEEPTTETETPILPPRPRPTGWLSELTDEQKAELKAMGEEFHSSVQELLDLWEIEKVRGWVANLTDEQRAELKAKGEEFGAAFKAKLEEWEIEIPKPAPPRPLRGFCPMRPPRRFGGFGGFTPMRPPRRFGGFGGFSPMPPSPEET